MDRHWLLTWTTYGTWLPGDPRGSVTSARDGPGPRFEHDQPGTPCDGEMPGLRAAARAAMKGGPIRLTLGHAEILLGQFRETAAYRGWRLRGVAIMANHCHLVAGVADDPDPEKVEGDFKSYGSRALNRHWGKPVNGSWWTRGGSKRKLRDEQAVAAALQYLRDQAYCLLLWLEEDDEASRGLTPPEESDPSGG